jgi:lysyl-tRNA synthetase class 2
MQIPHGSPHTLSREAVPAGGPAVEALTEEVTVQGQVMAARLHKNWAFFTVGIPGVEERQVVVGRPPVEEGQDDGLANIKIGDLVAASGTLGETAISKRKNLGQISLFATALEVVADNEVPRWPGEDVDAQLERQASYTTSLLQRNSSRKAIRDLLDTRGYVEVETSILQQDPSGAAARTFSTEANFNGREYHLRIAPEIDLKLVMARSGLPRVYEIGRNFRNEGVSPTHHPEFTNMEMYTAGMQADEAMDVTRELLATTSQALGTTEEADFAQMPVLNYGDLFSRHLGIDIHALAEMDDAAQTAHLRHYLTRNNILDPKIAELQTTGMLDLMFKKVIRPKLVGATIVTGYLSRQMPLADTTPGNSNIVDGFQVIVGQQEVVKAYNELTDPEQLQINLAAQAGEAEEDATATDPRLIEASRMGLPQMYGIGLGLDRFHALMTNQRIEDIIPVAIR